MYLLLILISLILLNFVYQYSTRKSLSKCILFILCLAIVFIILYFVGVDLVLPTAYAEGSSVSGDSESSPPSLDSESGPSSNNTSDREIETITDTIKEIIYNVNKENLSSKEKSAKIIAECKDFIRSGCGNQETYESEWLSYKETLKDRMENIDLYFESDWSTDDSSSDSASLSDISDKDVQNQNLNDQEQESELEKNATTKRKLSSSSVSSSEEKSIKKSRKN